MNFYTNFLNQNKTPTPKIPTSPKIPPPQKKIQPPPSPALTQNTDHLKNQNLPILLNDNSQYFCSGHVMGPDNIC